MLNEKHEIHSSSLILIFALGSKFLQKAYNL